MARTPKRFYVELAWIVGDTWQYADHSTNASTKDKAIENAIFRILGKTSREMRAKISLWVRVTDRWEKCPAPKPPPQKKKEKQLLLF